MIDLTQLLQAVIALAAALITAYVVPYIKSKVSNEKLEQMKAWARIGVKAAEQMYTASGQGEVKKAYVLQFLNQHGFILDTATLDALIESAVNDINNEQGFIIEQEVEL